MNSKFVLVGLTVFAILGCGSSASAPEKLSFESYDEKSNKLIYEGRFKDDKPIGPFRYYNFNDSIKAIIDFKEDGKTAYGKHFHFNGKLSAY